MFKTIMNHIHACFYDNLLLPKIPLVQLQFTDLHLLLYLNQHISIITYQYHHDEIIAYNDLMHNKLNKNQCKIYHMHPLDMYNQSGMTNACS